MFNSIRLVIFVLRPKNWRLAATVSTTACIVALLYTPCLHNAANHIELEKLPLAGKVICIDPGHGGIDTGSSYSGIHEKDLNLQLSVAVGDALAQAGATVVMTRTTDTNLSDRVSREQEIAISREEYALDQELGRHTHPLDRTIALGTRIPPSYRLGLRARLLIAAEHHADVFLSIHSNRFRSSLAQGSATLYQAGSTPSLHLAVAVQEQLGQLISGRREEVLADDFFILRRSTIPSVLIEVGFISNAQDRQFMLSVEGQSQIGEAITTALIQYFSLPSTAFHGTIAGEGLH